MSDAMTLLQHAFSALSPAIEWQQQGAYQYQLNGQPTDIQEPWRQGINAKGERIIQSLRSSAQHQMLLKVHWQQQPHGQSAQLFWQDGTAEPISACYQIEAERWHCQLGNRQLSGSQAAPWHFFPLLRVFSGAMVLALQQPQPLLLPDIEQITAPEDKLRPIWDHRQSRCINPSAAQREFVLSGGHYREDNARFFLNQAGLLQQYSWQQSPDVCWEITLAQSAD
ncbi:hypothetical protein [Alkalimonas sp.]|uniref:hypothetical protein n=1 Tax=Alkalimonas sp. TaxID=1872453 RepID=UPI00263B5355|nr:hypothetical protein [Alkalimonas sp.]MCC5825016.1 hypothetical protein [Alkalimonas sp.]